MQHTLAELVNQHRDQKQPDSEAMFLNFLAKTKSFWWRRLLQCSAWWRCRTSTRWIRKAWDTSNPFVDFFRVVAAFEASKFLSDLASVWFFRMIRPNPRHGLTNVQRVSKRLVSSRLWWKAVWLIKMTELRWNSFLNIRLLMIGHCWCGKTDVLCVFKTLWIIVRRIFLNCQVISSNQYFWWAALSHFVKRNVQKTPARFFSCSVPLTK